MSSSNSRAVTYDKYAPVREFFFPCSSSKYRVFMCVISSYRCTKYRIFIALCIYCGFLDKHSLVRRRNARSSGDEEGSAEHQTKVRSCGCALFFLHQRNEWHNEATSLNVREPSVALPVGLCRRQKGETREEGGHVLGMFALSVK